MRAQHGVGHGVERNRQVQIGAVLAPQYRQALDPRSSAAPAPPRRCHPPTHRLSDRGRSQPQQLLSCQFIVRRPAADSRRHRHRASDTDHQQHARRTTQGTPGLSTHRPFPGTAASNCGAVGSGATVVSDPERSAQTLPEGPPTRPATAPCTGVSPLAVVVRGGKSSRRITVNCRI